MFRLSEKQMALIRLAVDRYNFEQDPDPRLPSLEAEIVQLYSKMTIRTEQYVQSGGDYWKDSAIAAHVLLVLNLRRYGRRKATKMLLASQEVSDHWDQYCNSPELGASLRAKLDRN